MQMNDAYHKAQQLLLAASTPKGYLASVHNTNNYKRIWTRDGVVIGLAALCTENATLIQTFKRHLQTVFEHQHPTGFLPSNVDIEKQQQSYGGSVGRTDNGSWGVIGLCLYSMVTQKDDLLERYRPAVEKIFHVMDVWEFNGKHLIYMPQSGNWADEYFGHGYILSEQLLRLFALRLAALCYVNKDYQNKAITIQKTIEKNFWNRPQQNKNLYFQTLENKLDDSPKDYWLMGFNPSGYYQQCDLLANALSLILKIGEQQQRDILVEYLTKQFQQSQFILPCFSPIIKNEDAAMQQLKNLYAFEFRNYPGEFHNGGLWTVWNSFLVWALQTNQSELAKQLTPKIHQANAINNWDFNEYIDAKNQEAKGVSQCSWSAAASILAEKNDVLQKAMFGII